MPDITANRPVSGGPIESTWGQGIHDAVEGIQGGLVNASVPASPSTGTVAVVFPRPFLSTPTVLVVCASIAVTAGWSGQTPTGFNLLTRRNDGGGATTQGVQWLAIGPVTPAA